MATLEITFLQSQLEKRKQRLEEAIGLLPKDGKLSPQNGKLSALLREVDSALQRMDDGRYGFCDECHEAVEPDRLMANPLCRYCLDHLTQPQRTALQRDLDLAAEVQRNLLPQSNLKAGDWETCYHYAPHGPVSGDYCDLIPHGGQLFFVLGDVSGKGVAASMLMTQLHALFRSLAGLGLPLGQVVAQANRVLCESAMAGQYATLVCGLAHEDGEVEIYNAGHCPAIVGGRDGAVPIESMGVPVGMFLDGEFAAARLKMDPGDTLFLFTDGLSEANCGGADGAGDEFGVERVARFVHQHGKRQPSEVVAACLEELQAFTGGDPLLDDLTVLAIQRR